MKKIILTISVALLAGYTGAQQQLQNPGFEDWDGSGATKEPTNWSSLKTADAMASLAPEVMSQVAGRTGNWAVELEVKTAMGIPANGLITNGRVHAEIPASKGYVFTDANDARWNTPFTDRPDSIVGWYKHAPSNGDKSKIEIILHKGTVGRLPMNATTLANRVARARFDFTETKTEWTRFSKAFSYSGSDAPEYVLTTIAAGDSTIAKAGTKLWIDDLELIYNPLGVEDQQIQEIAINGSHGYLYFDIEEGEKVNYSVADVSGKIVQSGRALSQTPFKHESGIYFIQVETGNETFTKKLYINQ